MTELGDLLVEFKERQAVGDSPPVLTLTEHNGFVLQSERFNKRLATEDTSKYKLVRRDDIAFNPYLLWAGAVAQNTIVDAGVISPLYPTFRARSSHDPRYVARLLLAPQMVGSYDGIAFGAVPRRRRSSVSDFLALPVPTPPPLDEQRRIAAILDRADALRAKRRQALAHLDDLTQSIFLDMLGGGTFGDVALADLALGFRYGTSTKSGDAGLPTLRIPNVVGGALDLTDLKLVAVPDAEARRLALQSGDLLFVRTNGNPHNVGRCAVFEPRVAELAGLDASRLIYASYLIRLRPNRDLVEPSFLREFLLSSAGRRQLRHRSKTSAGQYNINIEGIGSVRVPEIAIADQREFSSRVAEIHSHRIDFQVSADSLDQLFASLQSRAFSGQL